MADFYVGPQSEPDKYRLVHQVGGGGEAQLWKAEVAVAGTWEPVAVKILRSDRLADLAAWKARWSEQAEVLHFIRHPGVVGVREHFEGGGMHTLGEASGASGSLYLVMNWVDGQPLREWVPLHRSPDDFFESLRYLSQVGDVLDWLHSGQATPSGRPVIHADVTPANVIVTGAGQAVLVDFGLIRLATGAGPVVEGTRGYMAPEVLATGNYSPASDRYSFAALTYYVLTGNNPPADLPSIRAGLAAVPVVATQEGLVDHLMTMFDPDPAQRPPAGDWIRYFRVSGTTSGGATGLRPTMPLAAVVGEEVVVPNRPWTRRWPAAVIAALVVLFVAGMAIAATAGGGSGGKGGAQASGRSNTLTRSTGTTSTSTTSTSTSTTTATTTPTLPPAPSGQMSSGSGQAFTNSGTAQAPTGSNAPLVNTYLEDMQPVAGSENSGAYQVNGVTYAHSISVGTGDYCSSSSSTVQYNLERQFNSFQATIGLTDQSPATAKVEFDVYLDGNKIFTGVFGLGQSQKINLSVSNGLRLRLDATPIEPSTGSCPGYTTAVWGDAEVFVS